MSRAMRKHPDVLELRERFRPLLQMDTFGRLVNASKTEVKETLSSNVVLSLISQFLKEEHLEETLMKLEEESNSRCS